MAIATKATSMAMAMAMAIPMDIQWNRCFKNPLGCRFLIHMYSMWGNTDQCATPYVLLAVFTAIYVHLHALSEFTLNYVDSDGFKWMYMDLNGLGWVSRAREGACAFGWIYMDLRK